MELARELRNSGSDIITEWDLAQCFGDLKIDPNFNTSFRSVVRESKLRDLSTILDIELDSGAGPTVHRSLKDRTYFSTVV
jgi:hypothetical protein